MNLNRSMSFLSGLNLNPKPKSETFTNVIDGLKAVYKNKLLPLELEYLFHDFHSPALDDIDFEIAAQKPMVLLGSHFTLIVF